MAEEETDEWQLWWDVRLAAIERVLGPSDEIVGHSMVPFNLGPEIGGAADVVYFRKHVPGIVAVTSELIGCEEQPPNLLGNYELMICQREKIAWGAAIISRLAHYTLQTELNSGETMDIGSAVPEGSTITAFLFLEYARFDVRGKPAGLLLCLGITDEELEACRRGDRQKVEESLRSSCVYPFTDLFRKSTIAS